MPGGLFLVSPMRIPSGSVAKAVGAIFTQKPRRSSVEKQRAVEEACLVRLLWLSRLSRLGPTGLIQPIGFIEKQRAVEEACLLRLLWLSRLSRLAGLIGPIGFCTLLFGTRAAF
uniref:Uncharacterized protein n=1 Tax=Steinernema glaseri TaxID=37863 RepID=A0A1I7YWH1_9BILA